MQRAMVAAVVALGACATTTRHIETTVGEPQIAQVTPDTTGGVWVVRRKSTYGRAVTVTTEKSLLTSEDSTDVGDLVELGAERLLWLCTRVQGVDRPQCFEATWNSQGPAKVVLEPGAAGTVIQCKGLDNCTSEPAPAK